MNRQRLMFVLIAAVTVGTELPSANPRSDRGPPFVFNVFATNKCGCVRPHLQRYVPLNLVQ